MVEKKIENLILTTQRSEIAEHSVYQRLSQLAADPHSKNVLKQISDDISVQFNFSRRMLDF